MKDKKIQKGAIIGIVVMVIIFVVIYWAATRELDRSRTEWATRIVSEGPPTENTENTESIEELRRNIALYEKQIAQYVADVTKTGAYWKILAIRLQDMGLHGEALKALERAIYYTPADAALHNATGISAGTMAKSVHLFPGSDNTERQQYYALAE